MYSKEEKQWSMFIHLSQLSSVIIPLAGIIVPIVLWQMKKESDYIDQNGKIVVNWIISALIYGAVFFILSFIGIGIPLLFVLGIATIIFSIIGGIKANNGEIWKYPLSLTLLK